MDEPKLWEKVRKCELLAQKLSISLGMIGAELKRIEETVQSELMRQAEELKGAETV